MHRAGLRPATMLRMVAPVRFATVEEPPTATSLPYSLLAIRYSLLFQP